MPDKLEEIFRLQQTLNERILAGDTIDRIRRDPKKQAEWVLNYCRAMSQEVAELTDSVPWKWWAKYQTLDVENAKVEVVDLMHFLVSAALVLGMDAEEFFRLYDRKHQVNQKRQDTGYAVKDENDNRGLAQA